MQTSDVSTLPLDPPDLAVQRHDRRCDHGPSLWIGPVHVCGAGSVDEPRTRGHPGRLYHFQLGPSSHSIRRQYHRHCHWVLFDQPKGIRRPKPVSSYPLPSPHRKGCTPSWRSIVRLNKLSSVPRGSITTSRRRPKESTAGSIPPPAWPDKGAISIEKLCITYAPELPDVLHNVSLDIEPGMRGGIVGSTGSGKSTLALALFRSMEARSGRITIDGRDIKGMPVPELRKRINMVVQDGSLNSGTLRDALDLTQTRGERLSSE